MNHTAQRIDAQASDGMHAKKPGHTRDRFNRFAWRDKVFADTDVTARVKCLAFGVAQFINHETGEAVVGTRALAEACGMSQTWVSETIPLLAKTGWMQVLQKGRRGSGVKCAGHYKMNRWKEHPVCSHPDVLQAAPREHFSPSREHPGCSEPLNHKSAPPARSSEYVEREEGISINSARAIGALIDLYPMDFKDNTETDAEKYLHRLLRNGESFAEISKEAKTYGNELSQNGGDSMLLVDWLRSAPWKNRS